MGDEERQSHLGKPLATTAFSGSGDGTNRRGRAKKRRMLSEMLGRAGGVTLKLKDGSKISRRRLVAEMLWDAIIAGEVQFDESGRKIYLRMEDWADLVKFLYTHLDGPPRVEMDLDVNSRGSSAPVVLNIEQMFGSVLYLIGQHEEQEQPIILDERQPAQEPESGLAQLNDVSSES